MIVPASSRPAAALYEPMSSFVVRAPALSIQRYESLSDQALPGPPHLEPTLRNAFAVASPTLLAALDHPPREARRRAAAGAALLRYLIRMSTRPTPYGLFAAPALGTWASTTALRIAAGPRPVRVRPDMGWLVRLALDLEGDRALRRQARLVRNPCAFERDGRLILTERGSAGRPAAPDVSIRIGPAVRLILETAAVAVPWDELVRAVAEESPGVQEHRIAGLIDQLCEQDLLLSELRARVTADPFATMSGQLAGTQTGAALTAAAGRLDRVTRALRSADPGDDGVVSGLADLRQYLGAVHPVGGDEVVQVDSALPLADATLSAQVGVDAARAVDLLLRMHPNPGGPRQLAGYRAAFLARYGPDRLVPVLELLDPRFGLGPPGPAHARGAPQHREQRSQRLLELAHTAMRDGADELELIDDDVQCLTTWTPDPQRAPRSVELSAFVAAASAQAIDRGEYLLVVGPNLGAQAAGRGLARFADLLGPDAFDVLQAAAERNRRDGVVDAELAYLPTRFRSANVTIRPSVHQFEIPVGVAPGVPADRVIPVHELAVFVADGRLRLWWTARQLEVSVCPGTCSTRTARHRCADFCTRSARTA